MAQSLRIKRRIAGAAGPPASLLNAELAFNEVSGVLYYGQGADVNTGATSIIAIGGSGAFVNLTSNQTIAGAKTFTSAVALSGGGTATTPPTNDDSNAIATTAFVKAQNYAALVGGLIPSAILPSYVDDVLEYAQLSAFPVTGETGKIYIAKDTNKSYRWSGSLYVEIAAAIGTTDGLVEGSLNLYFTAARASAAAPVQSVAGKTGTVTLTKNDVGLDQVDNVPDISKPISFYVAQALVGKANAVHTHTISDIGNLTATLATKLDVNSVIDGGIYSEL